LQEADIAHQYHEYPGGHDWKYWESHLADVLRFFDRALTEGRPSPL
jgi:enterochelin esterase-like enzyme